MTRLDESSSSDAGTKRLRRTSASSFADHGMGVAVELDLFSGRPNPRVVLSGEEAKELLRRLEALPRAPLAEFPDRPGLGYRGIRLRGGSIAPAVIYGGLVRQQGAGARTDPGRTLERWLLQTLDERLEPGLRPTIQQILQEL